MNKGTPSTLNDVSEFIVDCLHATAPIENDGYPLIRTPNIGKGRLDLDGVQRVSQSTYETWTQRAIPQPGDLIFAREAPAGNVAIVLEGQQVCLGQRTVHIRPSREKVNPNFLCYFLLAPQQQGLLLAAETGATAKHINMKDIRRLPLVRLPELAAQQRIGSMLADYDDLIDNNRRRIKLLEDSVRLLFDEWFVKGHKAGWPTSTLQQLCADEAGIQTGPFGSQLHQSDYAEEGVPVVMPKDLATMKIDTQSIARIPEHLADELGRHRMQYGDIVFGRRGEIGRRAYIGRRQIGYFCGTGCLRLRPSAERVNPRFLFEALRAPAVAGDIASRAKGSTMANLSAGAMQTVTVPVPPRQLQDRFAAFVEDASEQVDTLDEQSRKLRTARDLLLPRLMSGELTV